jgi:Uma2 family endonuclease
MKSVAPSRQRRRRLGIAGRSTVPYCQVMVASVLTYESEETPLDELLQPEPLAQGAVPEQRVVYCGLSWKRYLAFDHKLGDDRPGPRLYFLDGELEIMTTSKEHERIKEWIGGLLDIYFDEARMEIMPRGQATMRLALREAGAEPDKSWCIGPEEEFPDLVLEIALTSGGVNKLELYRRFKVAEVWFWRHDQLEIFVLDSSGHYERSPKSRVPADLDVTLIERCVAIRSWQQARQTFRDGLSESCKGGGSDCG